MKTIRTLGITFREYPPMKSYKEELLTTIKDTEIPLSEVEISLLLSDGLETDSRHIISLFKEFTTRYPGLVVDLGYLNLLDSEKYFFTFVNGEYIILP